MDDFANQVTRDLKTAAELAFAGAIVSLEAVLAFGVLYLFTH